jgi:hypothetical protein
MLRGATPQKAGHGGLTIPSGLNQKHPKTSSEMFLLRHILFLLNQNGKYFWVIIIN